MPAPRLLDKKIINATLATERKQEIDKGIKLAKSIDALRETKAEEEQKLEEFRENTLKAIQIEIESKQTENVRLRIENKSLKEERIRLEAPIDLTEARNEVKEREMRYDSLNEELLSREIDVSTRENVVTAEGKRLADLDGELSKEKKYTEENLERARRHCAEATQLKEDAYAALLSIRHDKRVKEGALFSRQIALEKKETALGLREKELEEEKLDIINQKIFIADQRATLERGFAELRRKQN